MWLALLTMFVSPLPVIAFVAGLLGLRKGIRERRPVVAAVGLGTVIAILTGRWWLRLLRPSCSDEPKPLAPERRGTAEGDGVTLEWQQFGPDDAPCLLLSAGWSLTHDAWYYQKQEFRKDYRVIVWDLRHNGRSSAPTGKDYTPEANADDLACVFRAVDAGRHPGGCVLIGHSWGAMILPIFAARHPQLMKRVRGLVFLSGSDISILDIMAGGERLSRLRKRLLEPIMRAMCRCPQLFDGLARIAWQIGAVHLAMAWAQRGGQGSRGQVDLIAHRTSHVSMCAAGYVALASLDFDTREVLRGIEVPTLVVGGARDKNMPPPVQHDMAARMPNAELVILPNCGHLTQLEGYRQTNPLIRAFLARVLPS